MNMKFVCKNCGSDMPCVIDVPGIFENPEEYGVNAQAWFLKNIIKKHRCIYDGRTNTVDWSELKEE